jgi:uncharacterized membrane protein
MAGDPNPARHDTAHDGGGGRDVQTQRVEPRWQSAAALLAAIGMYWVLPARFTVGPAIVVVGLEGLLLGLLMVVAPHRHEAEPPWQRVAAIATIVLINAANFVSLGLLVRTILLGNHITGRELFLSAVSIWLTGVIVFALWFWELDRGGPHRRTRAGPGRLPDFLFPQMTNHDFAPDGWRPLFVDYLYVSFTNASAFSPTDTMPLSRWAKLAMLAQSLASLLTVALVTARAVNILK